MAKTEPAVAACLLSSLDDTAYTAEARRCAGAALGYAAAYDLQILHQLVDRLAGLTDRDFARFVLGRLTDAGTKTYTRLRDELGVPGLPRLRPPPPPRPRYIDLLRQRRAAQAREGEAGALPGDAPAAEPGAAGEGQ
jgi:hypothetical protein